MLGKVLLTSYHSRVRIPREPGHADADDGLQVREFRMPSREGGCELLPRQARTQVRH